MMKQLLVPAVIFFSSYENIKFTTLKIVTLTITQLPFFLPDQLPSKIFTVRASIWRQRYWQIFMESCYCLKWTLFFICCSLLMILCGLNNISSSSCIILRGFLITLCCYSIIICRVLIILFNFDMLIINFVWWFFLIALWGGFI